MLPGAGARLIALRRPDPGGFKRPVKKHRMMSQSLAEPHPGSRARFPRRLPPNPPTDAGTPHRHRQDHRRASGDGCGIRRAPRRPESSRQNKRCQSSDPRGGFRVPPRVDVIARARRRDPPGRLQAKVIFHQPRRRQPRARPARRRAGRAVLVGRHPNHPQRDARSPLVAPAARARARRRRAGYLRTPARVRTHHHPTRHRRRSHKNLRRVRAVPRPDAGGGRDQPRVNRAALRCRRRRRPPPLLRPVVDVQAAVASHPADPKKNKTGDVWHVRLDNIRAAATATSSDTATRRRRQVAAPGGTTGNPTS